MAEKKEKQYVNDTARLMAEWDWEKNNELGFNPQTLTESSNKKVWWVCNQGHEWLAVIGSRKKGHGCPYCAGQKAITPYGQKSSPALDFLILKSFLKTRTTSI